MTPRTSPWPAGAPCWVTLGTGDEARARAFYGAVLGWSFDDAGPRAHDWTLASAGDGVVAGIGAVRDDPSSSWLLSFAADDVEAAAARVVNAGGQVLQPPHDVLGGAARAAVARDPGGARFALLQAGVFTGATVVNAPGALLWEDGVASDPVAARAFYADVLGWTYTPEPRAGEGYALFGPADGAPWGGSGGGATPGWTAWFGVRSVDVAVDTAIGLGAGVLSGPDDGPWGRLARLQDPDGAVFGVMAPDWDQLPDRSG